jgi:TonB family protein
MRASCGCAPAALGRRAAAWCAALLFAPATAVAAPPRFSSPEPPVLESAAQLDGAVDALHRANWQVYAEVERSDPVHRAQLQELEKLLLTPQHEARLKELASRSRAQGAAAALQAALSAARELLWQENYRCSLVEWRLAFEERFAPHEQSVQRLADALSAPAREEPAARIAAARASLDAEFAAAMSAEPPEARTAAIEHLTGSFAAVLAVYNQARGELAAALSSQERVAGTATAAQLREGPCPLGVIRTSGRELPALGADNSAPNSFYPGTSRHAQFEGMVTVEAWVSSSGCMEKAAVYESSGVPELDQAAIRWTEQATFYPAERDHRAVDGTLRVRIRFQLTQ